MQRSTRVLLVLSALIPILGLITSRNATLLIYSLFVVTLLNRERLASAFGSVRLPANLKFFLAVVASGWLTEFFAWLDSYLRHVAKPALFHPQLIPDLILAIGFYSGWAITWLIVLQRWRFSLRQVFFATGILGIFIEQDGAVIAAIIASLGNPLLAAILAIYVFVVYGAAMGIPYLLAEKTLVREGRRYGWQKYPVVILGMYLVAKILFLVVAVSATLLNLIPARQLIWEHPFF